MSTLYLIPIEPLPERYSESWYRNIPKVLMEEGMEVKVIEGSPLTSSIEVGSFLDMNSTVAYKASQLQKIASLFHAKQIKDGDVFFVTDLEFWGVEAIRLMAQLNKVKIFLVGFLHAASYTIDDAFEVAAPYQKHTEVGWVAACDVVFVGSEYHKNILIDRRLAPSGRGNLKHRIVVTGNPMFKDDYAESTYDFKEKIVVLPNRVDWGKRPDLSFAVAALAKQHYPDWRFVVTTGRKKLSSDRQWLSDYAYWMQKQGVIEIEENLTKAQYHSILDRAAVMMSFSIEESFGYCIAESILYKTFPLIRSGMSHSEFGLGKDHYFKDEDEALDKLSLCIENNGFRTWRSGQLRIAKYFNVVKEIADVIKGLVAHNNFIY